MTSKAKVVVIGPKSCGKSQLIKLLADIEQDNFHFDEIPFHARDWVNILRHARLVIIVQDRDQVEEYYNDIGTEYNIPRFHIFKDEIKSLEVQNIFDHIQISIKRINVNTSRDIRTSVQSGLTVFNPSPVDCAPKSKSWLCWK